MNPHAKFLPVPVYTPPAIRLDPVWWLGELDRRQPVLAGTGNRADMPHIALYAMMGIGATLMVAFSGLLALLIRRNRTLNVAPAIRDSVVIGLTLTFALTMIVAGTLSAWGSHWIGGVHSDAGGMILTGWSRDGGDLRVAHLFATHAMHFIPIFGVASAYIFGPGNRLPIWLFSALFTGFVAFLYFQALAGLPFLPFIE